MFFLFHYPFSEMYSELIVIYKNIAHERPDLKVTKSFIENYKYRKTMLDQLMYGFFRKYSASPISYFKLIRLHGARRHIRVGKLSVTNVATKWGFYHFRRFSGTYRETFGELPSQTK